MIFGHFLKQKKKKKHTDRINKDRIVRNIRTLFKHEGKEDF